MLMEVGCSDNPNAALAATHCARTALADLDGEAGYAIAFCGGHHAPERFLDALREIVGQIPVIGGAAPGAMGPDMLGTCGFECALLLVSSQLPPPRIARATALSAGERTVGRTLAESLLPHLSPDSNVLLFYDSIPDPAARRSPIVGSRLLDGFYDVIEPVFGDTGPCLIGAGTIADMALTSGFIFDGDGVAVDTVAAAILPTCLDLSFTVMHGCTPASDFLEITRIDGARVLELDGRPAIETLAARLGIGEQEIVRQARRFGLTLGRKYGDPYGPFDEGAYVNRLVIGADPDTGALDLFEADFSTGSRVQLMLTDPDRMAESAGARTAELLDTVADSQALAALFIDCAGRAPAFSGAAVDEAEVVASLLAGRLPWIGFYSGVEIAPYLGRGRPLDWTGVLGVLQIRSDYGTRDTDADVGAPP
jgi:small ligand-binding sensory domain FIST